MIETQPPEIITASSIDRISPTRLFGPHDTFLTVATFSQDGKRLLTGDIEGYIRLWDTETGGLLLLERVFNNAVIGAAFGGGPRQPNTYPFAIAEREGSIHLMSLHPTQQLSRQADVTLKDFTLLTLGYNTHQRPVIACTSKSQMDKRIYLMYADNEEFIHAFSVGNEENPNVTLSQDGKMIAVGATDGTVSLRSTAKGGATLHKLQTDLDGVKQTALSADGSRIAAREDRGDRVRVYHVATATGIGVPIEAPFQNQFAFSQDGSLLAITSLQKGGSLHIYNVVTGERVRRIKGSSPLAFNAQGHGMAAGNNYAEYSKSITLWDSRQSENGVLAKIGAPLDTLAADASNVQQFTVFHGAHDATVTALAFSPDGMTLASGGTDDDIHLWNMETGGQSAAMLDHKADITSLIYSPDGKTLASSSGYFNNTDDNTVRLWDTDETTQRLVFGKHADKVVGVVYDPRGDRAISADARGKVLVWRTLNGEVERAIDTPSAINAIAISPDGALIATAHGSELAIKDKALRLWNIQTGERIREYTNVEDWLTSVTFSPDGNIVLATDYSRRVCGWDINSNQRVLDLTQGSLTQYNPQNSLIAISEDKIIKLVSVRGSSPKMTLRHGENVTSMAFNAEGELLAVGLQNGDIVIWGVPEGAGQLADTGQMERRRVMDSARSGRYVLQLISLSCIAAQERDGDEIFIRVDGQTIWAVKNVGRRMRPNPSRFNEIDTFDFSSCRMHGVNGWTQADGYDRSEFRFGGLTGPIELEIWEEDQFFRGGNDYVGQVVITPAQAGQNMIRAVVTRDRFSYTLTYGVLFE